MHRLVNHPLAILPEVLPSRLARARAITPEQIAAWERDPGRLAARAWREQHPDEPSDAVEIGPDGIAVLKIRGAFSAEDDFFSWLFGDTTYASIERDLDLLLGKAPRGIVIDASSPGGDAEGPGRVARKLYEARGKVPLVCYTPGKLCSAAYHVGSACDEVVIEPAAILGSIGTIIEFTDFSALDEKVGIKTITLRSSQSPYKRPDPATDEGRARWQRTLDDVAAVFVSDVARNRGVTDKVVLSRYGQGDVLVGQAAVDAGLADRIATLAQVRAEIVARTTRSLFPVARTRATSTKETSMAMKCSGCQAAMNDGDRMYCGGCYDGAAEAKALGLAETATAADRRARAAALVRLEQAALAATGAKGLDEAIGAVAALATARTKLEELERTRAAEAEQARLAAWRAELTAAATSNPPKLTPALLGSLVPAFLDPEHAATAHAQLVASNAGHHVERLVAALSTVAPTEAELARLRGYLAAAAPALPTATREQEMPAKGGNLAGLTPDEVKAVCTQYGLSEAAWKKYANQ